MTSHAYVLAQWASPSNKLITTHLDVERDAGTGFTTSELNALAAAAASPTEVDAIMAEYAVDLEFRAGIAYGYDINANPAYQVGPPEVGLPFRKQKTTLDHVSSYTSAGLVAGNSTTPETAVVMSLMSTFPGPQGRGRQFWPQLPEATVDGTGSITLAKAQALKVLFDDWRTVVESAVAGVVPVIVSLRTGDWHDVAASKVGLRMDSQRRRRQRENTYAT